MNHLQKGIGDNSLHHGNGHLIHHQYSFCDDGYFQSRIFQVLTQVREDGSVCVSLCLLKEFMT